MQRSLEGYRVWAKTPTPRGGQQRCLQGSRASPQCLHTGEP